jgi:peptidoglycan glycosyltransferase
MPRRQAADNASRASALAWSFWTTRTATLKMHRCKEDDVRLGMQRQRLAQAIALGLLAGCAGAWIHAEPAGSPGLGAETLEQERLAAFAPSLTVHSTKRTGAKERGETTIAQHLPAQAEDTWRLPATLIDVRAAELIDGAYRQTLPDGTLITFTLDPRLQASAQGSLKRYGVDEGAVVIIEPSSGRVLAYASRSERDPSNGHVPLQAGGPAASIFKIITTAALLERGLLTPASRICTRGGARRLTLDLLKDSSRHDTRCDTLASAFGASRNSAYARWADRLLTPTQLEETAERFLFNQYVPFLWGLDASVAHIPTGDRLKFAQAAAGFTGTSLSPLHGALIVAAIGNEGLMMAPRLVARAERDGVVLYEAEAKSLGRVVGNEVARDLRSIFASTVEQGSARKFFRRKHEPRIRGVRVGGKTGHLTMKLNGESAHHSWFVGLSPLESPDLAISALVVNGEIWTTKGVVLASDILTDYYKTPRRTAQR